MAWASMKLCLRGNVPQNEIDKEPRTGYFGVQKNDNGGFNVEVRVAYKHTGTGKNKDIGKFYRRINHQERAALVVAVFLVDVISHYGGRKSLLEAGGDKDAPDIKHRCFHQIFPNLPRFPENLVQLLNTYIPVKGKVPEAYREFIVTTWSDHKNEVLKLFDICVAAQRLHPLEQGLTQTVTSIVFHGEPEPLTEEMETDEVEASRTLLEQVEDLVQRTQELTLENERLKVSDHENKKIIVELRSQLSFIRSSNMCCIHCNTTTDRNQGLWSTHIDKCLSGTSPVTRAEADKIPSEIPCEGAVPMEEEMTPHFEIPLDWEYLYSQGGEQSPFLMALPADLEHLGDLLGDIPADLSENDLSDL